MERAFSIIKELNLEHYLKLLLTKNTSNVVPYHNLKHTLTMMTNSYDIFNDSRTDFGSYDNTLYEKYLRAICIAALFHDFNHSSGLLHSDADNIRLALDAWHNFAKEELFG